MSEEGAVAGVGQMGLGCPCCGMGLWGPVAVSIVICLTHKASAISEIAKIRMLENRCHCVPLLET